jgi:hypothetical protein
VATGVADGRAQKIPAFGGAVKNAHYYNREGAGFTTVAQADPSHPAMKDAAAKDATPWPDVKVFFATVVDPGDARVVAKLADGTPLLLDKQLGEGHVLLFASGFDNLTNDLPLSALFVPFVDRTARYLSGTERLGGARVVDSFVQLRAVTSNAEGKKASSGASVDIIGPDGKRPLSLREAAVAQSFQLAHAGFYQIQFANGRDALIAVNADPRESEMKPMSEDALKLWSGSGNAATATAGGEMTMEDRKSVSSLWWWVMLLVLIAGLAETVVGSRYLGTQREEA